MGQRSRKFIERYWWQLELVGFVILSLIWVLPGGAFGQLYVGDDLIFHLNRVQGLLSAIQQGGHWWQVPAVTTGAFSAWGYPINLFYPAVTLLPLAWIQLVIPGIPGYVCFLFLLNLVTLVVAAAVAHRLLGSRTQACLAAVLYGFAQYRFLDFFVRGALAEGIVFAFLPLVFYGSYCIVTGDYHRWYWLAIGMALIALTHVASLVLAAIAVVLMLGLWGLRRQDLQPRLGRLAAAIGLTVALALSFLGPLLQQLHHVGALGLAKYDLKDSALQLSTFLANSLGDAVASGSINMGLLLLATSVIAIIMWRQLTALDRYWLVLGAVFIYLSSTLFPWALFQNILGVIQFPWRFLALATFPLALVGAKAVARLTKATTLRRWAIVAPVTLALILGLTVSSTAALTETIGPTNPKLLTTATYPAAVKSAVGSDADYVPQQGQVSMAAVRTHSIPVMNTQLNGKQPASLQQLSESPQVNGIDYTLHSTVTRDIKLPQLMYLGEHVSVNGHEQTPRLDSNDVVHITVHQGTSHIRFLYRRTGFQHFCGAISWLAWLVLLGLGGWRWWRQRQSRVKLTSSDD